MQTSAQAKTRPASVRVEINNHHGKNPIEVVAYDWSSDIDVGKKLVGLVQYDGSCQLHHMMTPDQARSMADALLACAESLEAVPS